MYSLCFITEDVRKLVEFYEKVMQVKADTNDIHVNIPLDDGDLVIYSKDAAKEQMGFSFDKYDGTGKTLISFYVDNVDDEFERLRALNMNIEFVSVPKTHPWGARSMQFRDFDGNIIGFVNRSE